MPKARTRRKDRFQFGKNRKNSSKKNKRRENPRIDCAQVRAAWDARRSVKRNLEDMGLSSDPNRSMPVRVTTKHKKEPATKTHVAQELEMEASLPVEASSPGVSLDIVHLVRHLLLTHGDDFGAMARDEKNYYQDTPSQIRRKVEFVKRHNPLEWISIAAETAAAHSAAPTAARNSDGIVGSTAHGTDAQRDVFILATEQHPASLQAR